MTFFANSGVAWPKLEQQTRDAGTRTLHAASQLLELFSNLEMHHPADRASVERVADSLNQASDIYGSIASELGAQVVQGLSPSEAELAAVNGGRGRSFSEWAQGWVRPRHTVELGGLYRELSMRTERLASSLRTFEPNKEDRDLAPQVFSMMEQWEKIAVLGRIIAVLNRRSAKNPESSF